MEAYVRIEPERVGWGSAQREIEVRTGQVQRNTVHTLKLEMSLPRNGKAGYDLQGVPAIPSCEDGADPGVDRAGLFRPVLLDPENECGAWHGVAAIGDRARYRRGCRSAGRDCQTSLFYHAAEPTYCWTGEQQMSCDSHAPPGYAG